MKNFLRFLSFSYYERISRVVFTNIHNSILSTTIVLLFKNIRVRIAINRIHRLRNGENEIGQWSSGSIFHSPDLLFSRVKLPAPNIYTERERATPWPYLERRLLPVTRWSRGEFGIKRGKTETRARTMPRNFERDNRAVPRPGTKAFVSTQPLNELALERSNRYR